MHLVRHKYGVISIHSPRMGRDLKAYFDVEEFRNFNPLSPHGERHIQPAIVPPAEQ